MSKSEGKNDPYISLESELCGIDEENLPHIISQRMEILEKANKAFEIAVESEKRAREHVKKALKHADDMIEIAQNLGSETPDDHHIFKISWSTKSDRIQCLEENLKTLAEFGGDSANAQKELAEVQKALSDSQTSVLEVQRTQMEYQESVANATKFLYGLCTYSMASTQSIVTNLEAILSGSERKELGEMAKQQMFLVMDQLKSQENIITRLNENDEYIADIDEQMFLHEEKISALEKENKVLKEHDALHENQLKHEIESGKKQEHALQLQKEKDTEHDRLIAEGVKKDIEQDKTLRIQQEKDAEHDRILKNQQTKDTEHDAQIAELRAYNKKISEDLLNLYERINVLENTAEEYKYSTSTNKITFFTLGISVVAIILVIIQFFI